MDKRTEGVVESTDPDHSEWFVDYSVFCLTSCRAKKKLSRTPIMDIKHEKYFK